MPAAREFYRLTGALGLMLVAAAPGRAAPARHSPVQESAAERRAVRGVPVEDANLAESPELREVRRFEEETFQRGRDPAEAASQSTGPLPPGLEGAGRWGGSGDVAPEPRGAGTPPGRPTGRPPAPGNEWLQSLAMPDLPVRWEPQVVRFLQFFKNEPRGRAIMTSWLRKIGRYRALYDRVLDQAELPRDLIYVSMIESGFEPGAVSRVGAGGLWQFMPGVARAYGLEVSAWVDSRRDPERSVEAAARYLKDLHVRFGSWPLAFAAYHAGYGAVLKSIGRYNTNDYWELCHHEAGLPWETTLYVPKILAVAIIGHNLQAFGFADVIPEPAWAYDRVQAPPGTTLATVARAAGTRLEAIEALNPELIRGRTPPDRGPSTLRMPPGTATAYNQTFPGARAAADRVESVVLRLGETLEDVARARGLSVRELKKLNSVRDTGELRAGAAVVVPVRPGAAPPPAAEPEVDEVLVAVPEKAFSYEGRERVFYRTREGDTLEEIAEAFRVRTDELVEWNNVDPDAKLHPRLVLQLFVRKDFDRSGVTLLDPSRVRAVTLGSEEFLALEAARRGKTRLPYVARSGDTLAKIARRYGLQPGDLARINRLSSTSELQQGQTIYVYSPTPVLPHEVAVGRSVRRRPALSKGKGTAAEAARRPAAVTRKKAEPKPASMPARPAKAAPPGRRAQGNGHHPARRLATAR